MILGLTICGSTFSHFRIWAFVAIWTYLFFEIIHECRVTLDFLQDGPTAHVAALTSELQTLQHRLAQESQTLKEAQERLESSEARAKAAEEVCSHCVMKYASP